MSMKIDKKLELLQQIQRVEASPHLFTRIEARIQNSGVERISIRNILALGMGLLVLLLINLAIISNNLQLNKSKNGIAKSYGLSSTNTFYHD